MLLQCVQPLLDYMGRMGFKSWCYSHQEYLHYSGDPKPFTKTINHYTLFLNCGKGVGERDSSSNSSSSNNKLNLEVL